MTKHDRWVTALSVAKHLTTTRVAAFVFASFSYYVLVPWVSWNISLVALLNMAISVVYVTAWKRTRNCSLLSRVTGLTRLNCFALRICVARILAKVFLKITWRNTCRECTNQFGQRDALYNLCDIEAESRNRKTELVTSCVKYLAKEDNFSRRQEPGLTSFAM